MLLFPSNCRALHGLAARIMDGNSTVYYRQKIEGTGWRYRPLAVGRRPEAAKRGPYFIRVRNGAGKYQWVRHDTEQAAEKAAKAAPVARKAQELGLSIDDLTNEANTNDPAHQRQQGLLHQHARL